MDAATPGFHKNQSDPRHGARLRELAIMQVAHLSGARYEWVRHVPLAKRTGMTDEQIAALARGESDTPIFDGDKRLVLHVVKEAHDERRVSDDTFAAAAKRFSPREIVELLLIVGLYVMMSIITRSTDLPLDPPADTPWPASQPSGAA